MMRGPSEQRGRGGKERREGGNLSGVGRGQEGRCSTDPRVGGPARGLQGQGAVPLEPAPHFCITVWASRTKSWQLGLQETETVLLEAVHRLPHTLNSSTETVVPEEPGPDHVWVPERLPEKQAAAGLPLGTGMLAAIISVILILGLTPGLMGTTLEPPPSTLVAPGVLPSPPVCPQQRHEARPPRQLGWVQSYTPADPQQPAQCNRTLHATHTGKSPEASGPAARAGHAVGPHRTPQDTVHTRPLLQGWET